MLDWVKLKLARLGLTLHPEKTRIVHAKDGCDVLGVHVRLRPVRKRGSRLKVSCRLWPSDRSMTRITQRIHEVIGRRYRLSLEDVITLLNPVIRGLEQLSHTSLGGAETLPVPQSVCPGTVANFLKAHTQRPDQRHTESLV